MEHKQKEEIEILRQEILDEIKQEEARKKLIYESFRKIEKGIVTKEVFELPISSADRMLCNKNIDYRIYGALILDSNCGNELQNADNRYMYKDKFDLQLKEICSELEISESKIKKDIVKLKKCNIDDKIKVIEISKTKKGEVVYFINYGSYIVKDENTISFEKYVSITNVALRILINCTNDRMIRTYLFFLYHLRNGEKCVTQEQICEKIGYAPKSRSHITDIINGLEKLGFIDVKVTYEDEIVKSKNGVEYVQPIPRYYYSLSNRYFETKFEDVKTNRRRKVTPRS